MPRKKAVENRESFRHSRGDWPDQTVEANLALSPSDFELRYIGLVISVSRDKNAILRPSRGWKFLSTWLAHHAVRKSTSHRTSFSVVLRSVSTNRLFVHRFHYVTLNSSSLNNRKNKFKDIFCHLNMGKLT